MQQNITQETLSGLCDVDVRTIQRIEKGKQNITLKVLFNLSSSLNIKPDKLLNICFSETEQEHN